MHNVSICASEEAAAEFFFALVVGKSAETSEKQVLQTPVASRDRSHNSNARSTERWMKNWHFSPRGFVF